jgi:hypothetical protein
VACFKEDALIDRWRLYKIAHNRRTIWVKRDALAQTLAEFAEYMERNVGKQRDGGDSVVNHPVAQLAQLLVAGGSFSDVSPAVHFLLRRPAGVALVQTHKAEKESPAMRTEQHLESFLKDLGPVRLCKGIVDRGRAPCGEAALVAVLTKHVGGDREFAKLYEREPDVQRACSIAKAAEFAVFDDTPVVVGGEDAQDVDNATAALRATKEIQRIGAEKFPYLSADQQFARVFEDKNYAVLAAQAHSRPQPTTIYRMPGSDAAATLARLLARARPYGLLGCLMRCRRVPFGLPALAPAALRLHAPARRVHEVDDLRVRRRLRGLDLPASSLHQTSVCKQKIPI